jgi:hypothetical protein
MSNQRQDNQGERIDQRSTIVQLAKRLDGTWEATQHGLDIVGTGVSAARATADMARQIADQQEQQDR